MTERALTYDEVLGLFTRSAAQIEALTGKLDALTGKVDQLTAQVTRFVSSEKSIGATSSKSYVEKPVPYEGKDSHYARSFLAAFKIYALASGSKFNTANTDGTYTRDDKKWILGALSFLKGDAAIWAQAHLEKAADEKPAFDNSWNTFVKEFEQRFRPLSPELEAQAQLSGLKQDKGSVQQYLARFRMWAPQSGYSDHDLRTRFRAGLSDQLKDALAHVEDEKIDTYAKLVTVASRIDQALLLRAAERQFDKGKAAVALPLLYGGSSYNSTGTPMSAFADPNTMDIDASRFSAPAPSNSANDLNKLFNDAFKGKCNRCGSDKHNSTAGRLMHASDICKWCHKQGHWESACRQKFIGKPRVIAATDTSSPSVPSSSTVATPQAVNASAQIIDISAMQKQIEAMQAQVAALTTAGF